MTVYHSSQSSSVSPDSSSSGTQTPENPQHDVAHCDGEMTQQIFVIYVEQPGGLQ